MSIAKGSSSSAALLLNHPLISTKPNDFNGLQIRGAAEILSNFGHLRK
jgi:hypothetical protein